MRWCPVVLLAACSSDPNLSIAVNHPSTLVVSSTEIAVYQSATLTCENIEFGDLDASQLAAIQVAEETISPPAQNTGSLDGLSRTDHKVIVARGFYNGGLVSIGCAEQDVVSGNVQITITTLPAATISIAAIDTGTGTTDTLGRYVTTIDANGNAIDQRAVTWTVYGPAGTTAATGGDAVTSVMSTITGEVVDAAWQPAQPTLTCSGIATIHPVPPSTVAGYAVQVRVAWAAQSLPLYTTITPYAHSTPMTFSPPAGVTRFCAVGRSGTTSMLGCIETDAGNSMVVDLNLYSVGADGNITAAPGNPVTKLPAAGQTRPVAALAYPTTGTDIDLYVVDSNGLATKLLGTSNVTGCSKPICTANTFDDAIVVPACGTAPPLIVFHGIGTGVYSMAATDDTVTQVTLPAGGNVLDGGGCATRIDPSMGSTSVEPVFEIDFVSIEQTPTASRAFYPCKTGAGLCSLPLPVAGATLGFTGGDTPEMIVTNVTAAGAELDTSLIASIGNMDELLPLSSEPALTAPDKIAVGQFDSDQVADAIWGMRLKNGTLLELSYARLVLGQPLETLASAAIPIDLVDLATADINNDGIDDVIVLGAVPNSGTSETGGVLAIPIGVPAANGTLVTDAQCQ